MKNIFFSLLLLSILSCSKKHDDVGLKYTDKEFTHLIAVSGAAVDKTMTPVNFSDYVPGVNKLTAKTLAYEKLQFYALEFETETQAKAEALRLNQYHARNWLLDRVEGEPILEDLVILKFHGSNPKRNTQRKPVHIPKAPAASAGK